MLKIMALFPTDFKYKLLPFSCKFDVLLYCRVCNKKALLCKLVVKRKQRFVHMRNDKTYFDDLIKFNPYFIQGNTSLLFLVIRALISIGNVKLEIVPMPLVVS